MKIINNLIILFFGFFISTSAVSAKLTGNSEGVQVLTLETAIEIAIKNNPGLAISNQTYLAAQRKPEQVSALPDPVLTLGAMNFPTDTYDRDQEPMTQLQVGVQQAFPFPGKRGLMEESADYMVEIANLSLQEKRLMLIDQVTMVWWDVFYLDKALLTVNANKSLLKQLIKVAETKYKTGQGLQQDVLLSHLELSKILEKELQIKAMRKKKVSFLNSLLNNRPDNDIQLPSNVIKNLPVVKAENELYKLAEESSPLLSKAETKVSQSESNLALAKRGYLPDFKVGLTYGDRKGDNPAPMGGERTDFVSFMLGVKIPIYANRKQGSQIEESSIKTQEALYFQKDVRNRLFAEISSEYASYVQLKEQLNLFKNGILPQSKQTSESMLAGYQVSQVDFLNLVRSQMSLLNYELLYWETFAHSHKSLSKLKTLVGKEEVYE